MWSKNGCICGNNPHIYLKMADCVRHCEKNSSLYANRIGMVRHLHLSVLVCFSVHPLLACGSVWPVCIPISVYYRVFIKYCVFKIYSGLWPLSVPPGVSVCTQWQVEPQRLHQNLI